MLNSGGDSSTSRLGTAFHETFSLNRPAIWQILSAISEASDAPITQQHLREATGLGNNYVRSMPRYAVGSGLVSPGNKLTFLGKLAHTADQGLESAVTHWLMHYHLSAPHGPGPLFWHALVTSIIRPGIVLDPKTVADHIASCLSSSDNGAPAVRTCRASATIFLKSYSRPDGLSRMRLIHENSSKYEIKTPTEVPKWVFAYALTDYWDRQWADRATVSIGELTTQNGLGALFFVGDTYLTNVLESLQQEGVIDLYRSAPPHQVVRQWQHGSKSEFLESAYADVLA